MCPILYYSKLGDMCKCHGKATTARFNTGVEGENLTDVNQDTATGPHKDFVSVEAIRKKERDCARMYALGKWEELSPGNEEVAGCNCDDGDVDCMYGRAVE